MYVPEEDAKKIFARNLKFFMDLNEKRQIDVAKYLNCSSGLVSAWCNGDKMPRVNTINELCRWFNIEMSDMLMDKSKEQEDGYFINEDTKRIAKAIYDNPDMREMFEICSSMSPEHLKAHLEFMRKIQ